MVTARTSPSEAGFVVRPLTPADINAVIALVRSHEFASEHSTQVLRRLFEHGWDPAGRGLGYVLQFDNCLVGVICAINSTRLLNGVPRWVANMSTWYVVSHHRSHSLRLLKALCDEHDVTITNLSASAAVQAVLRRFGFKTLSSHSLFMPAWLARLLPPVGQGRVIDSPQKIERHLSVEHRQILRDHLRPEVGHHLLQDDGRYVYLITKRRPLKGKAFLPPWVPSRLRQHRFQVSDVLFVSDPQFAYRHWSMLRRHIAKNEATSGLTVQESFLGAWIPPAQRFSRVVLVRPARHDGTDGDAVPTDALYTEVVLLPLS